MKIAILYHPASDHSRIVEEYVHDFTRRNPEIKVDQLSLETRDGAQQADLYGVMAFPAILALRDSNELVQVWQGLPLPLMNDVVYAVLSQQA